MITRNRPTHRGTIRIVEMDLTGDDIVQLIKTPLLRFSTCRDFAILLVATEIQRTSGANVGAPLFSSVNGMHADLLVAGAGAHPRGLEHVLGVLTCAKSTEPVLVSGAQTLVDVSPYRVLHECHRNNHDRRYRDTE